MDYIKLKVLRLVATVSQIIIKGARVIAKKNRGLDYRYRIISDMLKGQDVQAITISCLIFFAFASIFTSVKPVASIKAKNPHMS